MMLDINQATDYLRQEGESELKVEQVLDSGFDLSKPLYLQQLYIGEKLYQYVRRFEDSGNWFCLRGTSMSQLAIVSGSAGRALTEFEVVYPCTVLEGSANPMQLNWTWSGGGPGGGTQLFLPKSKILSCLRSNGAGRW